MSLLTTLKFEVHTASMNVSDSYVLYFLNKYNSIPVITITAKRPIVDPQIWVDEITLDSATIKAHTNITGDIYIQIIGE